MNKISNFAKFYFWNKINEVSSFLFPNWFFFLNIYGHCGKVVDCCLWFYSNDSSSTNRILHYLSLKRYFSPFDQGPFRCSELGENLLYYGFSLLTHWKVWVTSNFVFCHIIIDFYKVQKSVQHFLTFLEALGWLSTFCLL